MKRLSLRILAPFALLAGSQLTVASEILGVTTQSLRGDDPIGGAIACQTDFGAGSRVCQSNDFLAPTAVSGIPAPTSPATQIYFRPSVVGVTGTTNVVGMDSLGLRVYPDSGLPACSIYSLAIGQAPLYFAAADCSAPKPVLCCKD